MRMKAVWLKNKFGALSGPGLKFFSSPSYLFYSSLQNCWTAHGAPARPGNMEAGLAEDRAFCRIQGSSVALDMAINSRGMSESYANTTLLILWPLGLLLFAHSCLDHCHHWFFRCHHCWWPPTSYATAAAGPTASSTVIQARAQDEFDTPGLELATNILM